MSLTHFKTVSKEVQGRKEKKSQQNTIQNRGITVDCC